MTIIGISKTKDIKFQKVELNGYVTIVLNKNI